MLRHNRKGQHLLLDLFAFAMLAEFFFQLIFLFSFVTPLKLDIILFWVFYSIQDDLKISVRKYPCILVRMLRHFCR